MIQSLSMAFNGVMPIIILVALGYFLRVVGVLSEEFCVAANSLCFKLFLPCMVFNSIYDIPDFTHINWTFVLFCCLAVTVLFLLGLGLSFVCTKNVRQRGVVAMCCFRSNSVIIGLVLMNTLFGQSGTSAMSVVLSFVIPLFTLYSVIALSVFHESGQKTQIKTVFVNILKNPLTIALVVAFAVLGIRANFTSVDISFRLYDIAVVKKTISTLGSVVTPLALISLGGRFKFASTKELLPIISLGTVIKLIVAPVAIFAIASLFPFGKSEFAVLLCLFASPIAVSSVVMSAQMGQDDILAGQLVVWTTICSFFTLFIYITLMSYWAII